MFRECPNNVTVGGWMAGAPVRLHFPTRDGGISHYLYGKIVCLYRAIPDNYSSLSWRILFIPWVVKKLSDADRWKTLAKGDAVILEGHLEYARVADPESGETWANPENVDIKIMQRVAVRNLIRVPRGRTKEEAEKWVNELLENANKPIVKRSALARMIKDWNNLQRQRG